MRWRGLIQKWADTLLGSRGAWVIKGDYNTYLVYIIRDRKKSSWKTIWNIQVLRAGSLQFPPSAFFFIFTTKSCFGYNTNKVSCRQRPGPMRCLFMSILAEFQLKMAQPVATRSHIWYVVEARKRSFINTIHQKLSFGSGDDPDK